MDDESVFFLRVEEAIAKGQSEAVRVKDIKEFLLRRAVPEADFRHLRLKRDLFEFAEQVAREEAPVFWVPPAIRKDPLPSPDPGRDADLQGKKTNKEMSVEPEKPSEASCDCDLSAQRPTSSPRLPTPPPLIFPGAGRMAKTKVSSF